MNWKLWKLYNKNQHTSGPQPCYLAQKCLDVFKSFAYFQNWTTEEYIQITATIESG